MKLQIQKNSYLSQVHTIVPSTQLTAGLTSKRSTYMLYNNDVVYLLIDTFIKINEDTKDN